MISCLLKKNLEKTDFCGYSLKQITDIYLANFAELTGVQMDETGYEVTGITGTSKWSHVEVAKDSASYNDDLVVGGNGSKYRTHSITFSFNGAYNKDLAAILDTLSLGRFVAVCRLSDGNAIMLGRLTGLEASSASSLSEAAADGQNGINITLECNTVESAIPVAASVLETIVTNKVTE